MPDLAGLPPETGLVIQSLQQQPMAIVAGMVGITAMTEEERGALLCEVDVQDALVRVVDIKPDGT